ncbi:unnamed protein product, partial [Brenthis ino]
MNQSDNVLKAEFEVTKENTLRKIKNAKDIYYSKEFENCLRKPKKMWRLINDLATNKIKDQSSAPPKLIVNNVLITDPVIICDTFNEYFSTIGTTLANGISDPFEQLDDDSSESYINPNPPPPPSNGKVFSPFEKSFTSSCY